MEIPLKTVVSQGRQAFGKRNFTAEEIAALQGYNKYYELWTERQRGMINKSGAACSAMIYRSILFKGTVPLYSIRK